jgi:hypothetical protein
MVCVKPDGRPTKSGEQMLTAIAATALTPEQTAAETGLALFKVRGGLRSMVEAGLAVELDGTYRATEKGLCFVPEKH